MFVSSCAAHPEPSRCGCERGGGLRGRACGHAGAVGGAWFPSQKVLELLPILNPFSRDLFLVGFVAECRDHGSFFPREFQLTLRRSGRTAPTRPSTVSICPDLWRSVDCAR